MAAQPLTAAMPPDMDLPDGYIVRFNAIDATTGAAVANVVVSQVSIFGTRLGTPGGADATYPPVLLKTRVLSG